VNVTLKQVPSLDVTRLCEVLQAIDEFWDGCESQLTVFVGALCTPALFIDLYS
jgi:hypothetical protein